MIICLLVCCSAIRKYMLILFWKSAVCDLTKGTNVSYFASSTPVWFCQTPGKSAAGVTENAAINKVQQVNWALLSQPNFLIAVEVTQQKLPEINTTVSRQRPV